MIAGVFTIAINTCTYAQSFVISDLKVNGLERLNSAVVFENINVQTGKTLNSSKFPEMIKSLYATGLFEDVSLSRQGNVLVINVKERSSISEIVFTGNKDIKTNKLNEILRGINFYPGQVFDVAHLDEIIKNLYQSYETRGKYSTRISTNIVPLPRNRVRVEFDVSEGRTALIKEINITGNNEYSDRKLKKQLDTGVTNFGSIISQNDRFSQEKLDKDLEKIQGFYKDRGYMKFEVNASDTALTHDGRQIHIDIDINEGNRYKVIGFEISGNTVVPKEELLKLIVAKKGKPYSHKKIQASIKAIQDRIGDEGYAFARVNAIPDIDEENKTVSFILAIDQGERAYVRNIIITGNERTQDEVFRREMRQMEGSWFVTRDVERSRMRIQRLAYVENIEANVKQIGNDQVDIEYKVAERSAGSISLGVSYGQESKFGFNAGFQQPNFMGTGKDFGISVETTDTTKSARINFTDPYFTDDGLSAGINLSFNKTTVKDDVSASYITDSYMLGLNFGYPITEYSNLYFDIGVELLDIKSTYSSPIEIVSELGGSCVINAVNFGYCYDSEDNENRYQSIKKNKKLIRTGISWVRDTRDRTVFASDGNMTRLSISGTVFGSSDLFYKLRAQHQFYYPLWEEDIVFSARGEINYGGGYGKTENLPFYENYYSGGLKTVRGYRSSSLGPRYLNGETSGASIKANITTEIIMTVPGFTENRNIRWSMFADGGQVFCKKNDNVEFLGYNRCGKGGFDAADMRYSAGISFAWFSPMGPLVFSYAKPLNDKVGDRTEAFQFSIGIPF